MRRSASKLCGEMADAFLNDVLDELAADELKDYGYISPHEEMIAYEKSVQDLQKVLVELVKNKRKQKRPVDSL